MVFKDNLKPGDRQYIVIIALYYYTQIFAASIISISTSKLNLLLMVESPKQFFRQDNYSSVNFHTDGMKDSGIQILGEIEGEPV